MPAAPPGNFGKRLNFEIRNPLDRFAFLKARSVKNSLATLSSDLRTGETDERASMNYAEYRWQICSVKPSSDMLKLS